MTKTNSTSRQRRQAETRVYGQSAVAAVFHHRPEDVVKAYVHRRVAEQFASQLKQLAQRKVAYKWVEDEDLEKLTATPHHGGICLVVRRRESKTLESLLGALGKRRKACLILLENVGNPHNLGAILRSAAHFAADAVLVKDAAAAEAGATCRTAAGGAEVVPVVSYGDIAQALRLLTEAGFSLFATSSHSGSSLFECALPARVVFLFGEEQHGLSAEAFAGSTRQLSIPGSGAVESLNVGVAASVLLAEYWRQQHERGPNPTVPPEAPAKRRKGTLSRTG